MSYNSIKKGNLQDISAISFIKEKTIANEIVFTRADKGNTVIAIAQSGYIIKTTEFLNSYDILDSDPTADYHSEIEKVILN